MTAELDQRLSEFGNAAEELVGLVAGLDDEQFNRRPDEACWSMAECVDHLVVVGRKMVPRLETAAIRGRGLGWTAAGPFKYGWFERWFARAMGEVPPKRRFKAPRLYVPRGRADYRISGAVADFEALQQKYADVVREAEGLDLARIKVASPVSSLLRLSLGQWLVGLAGHQRRHLWQAEQVKRHLLA